MTPAPCLGYPSCCDTTRRYTMPKTWDQLTQEEKIEDLRRDMLRLYEAVNSLSDGVQRTFSLARESERKVCEALAAIQKLQASAAK